MVAVDAASVTRAVKVKVPATVGVPEIAPLEERDRLVGKVPLARVHV